MNISPRLIPDLEVGAVLCCATVVVLSMASGVARELRDRPGRARGGRVLARIARYGTAVLTGLATTGLFGCLALRVYLEIK